MENSLLRATGSLLSYKINFWFLYSTELTLLQNEKYCYRESKTGKWNKRAKKKILTRFTVHINYL